VPVPEEPPDTIDARDHGKDGCIHAREVVLAGHNNVMVLHAFNAHAVDDSSDR
jgi:hypothetical protein